MAWQPETSDFFDTKAKRYGKGYPQEMRQMLDNLDRYLQGLNSGLNPMSYHPGFLHAESCGAKAIDASGIRKPAQTRLYVYPETGRQLLHVITVGDKKSQHQDNQDSCEYVKQLGGRI